MRSYHFLDANMIDVEVEDLRSSLDSFSAQQEWHVRRGKRSWFYYRHTTQPTLHALYTELIRCTPMF